MHRAFNNQSPSNASFLSQEADAGTTPESNAAFAFQFGARFASLKEDELSTKILGNMGVLPNAGLQTAVKDYLVAVGKANVGIVALQLGQILSDLENATGDQAIYSAAAVAWNNELVASYNYSTNPANIEPSPVGPIGMPGLTVLLTSGDDTVSAAQTSDHNDTILASTAGMLSSADVVDGGRGTDTLRATLAAAMVVSPTLTSVDNAFIKAGAGAEFSASGAIGLIDLRVDAAAGPATFSDVNLATTIGIQNSGAGGALSVKFANASGAADSASLVFADATGNDEIIVADIETLNVLSTAGLLAGTSTNQARITAAQAERITFSGGQALTTTVAAAKLSVIDASGLRAGLDLTLDGTAGISIALNALVAHAVALGDGADTVLITGMAGMAAQNMDLSTEATLAASAIRLSGFMSGTDVLKLVSANPTTKATLGSGELASISAASSLLAAATLAATTGGANKAIAFRYGVDTYILVNDGAAALGENDSLVKLAGVTALSDASWTVV
ncbi:bluetail domain-containing putative surface protein [Acidovorax sp.]|uniref:bluetail domain-containing putative surface protein n=1 Tax=Acidovorax sp. TaxID=1872122 RepID=UPI002ACE56C8|nr:bluetail domain-containing putative surface protein [Acidovorax sp.]MDZ7865347.1 bluetail domain-containing putative surface protein [Acidovorax sp.]